MFANQDNLPKGDPQATHVHTLGADAGGNSSMNRFTPPEHQKQKGGKGIIEYPPTKHKETNLAIPEKYSNSLKELMGMQPTLFFVLFCCLQFFLLFFIFIFSQMRNRNCRADPSPYGRRKEFQPSRSIPILQGNTVSHISVNTFH